ncbi:agmatine deiminase [Tamilnaduibacter salinus]|uniref:Agmatine deiminase n=1 Tax=Tamilnaduibacter salinus TaxID=1484056 RepID=A0A2U1CV06_9GAMM|nr:agmatine deiminase family protein [Tamilnaduibacter salinus]PVY75332.1 agmatine deiminase [Tamilnaduibacter salinus]
MSDSRCVPAEWAPQSTLILTWPHHGTDWRDRLAEVEPVFEQIARETLAFQNVLISCENVIRAESLESTLNAYARTHDLPGRVRGLMAPSNDTWARDHAPIGVLTSEGPVLVDFQFNGWGGKYDWEKDNAITGHLARQHAFDGHPIETVDFVLEGGSIDSDGAGTLLTTSQCLLTPTRNPSHDRRGIEAVLSETLGADRVLWLDHGYLAGDDTDCHIDTLARFCAADTITYMRCEDPTDEHYGALNAMENELGRFTQRDGTPYRLVPLPWPDPIRDAAGNRLPASYANFLIINGAVLAPVYDVAQDDAAVATLTELFPDRQVIPIPCRSLIEQGGSLHCLTMQIPSGDAPV